MEDFNSRDEVYTRGLALSRIWLDAGDGVH